MAEATAPITRTREIEQASNRYFIHPISRFLVKYFARWGLRPNTVSLMGIAFGLAAAVAYYQHDRWPMALLGFVLMIGWHVMDGADGQLARLTGQTSEIGKVLDGVCDGTAFVSVYISLSITLTPAMGPSVWILAALALASHGVQASAFEYQRQAYDFWVHGKQSARIVPLDEFRQEVQDKSGLARLFGQIHLTYLEVQYLFATIDETLQTRLDASLRGTNAADMRAAYRSINLGAVKRWSMLSANQRTVAIFLAALAGNPVYYFLFEIVLLNIVLVLLIRMQRKHNRTLSLRVAQPVDALR